MPGIAAFHANEIERETNQPKIDPVNLRAEQRTNNVARTIYHKNWFSLEKHRRVEQRLGKTLFNFM